jgi:hypothetical protein
MTRSSIFALVCAALLLGSAAGTAGASSPSAGNEAYPSHAVLVLKSYFGILNSDMRTRNFSSLASVYTANATLTTYRALPRDTYLEQTAQVHGLAAIKQLYRKIARSFAGYRWILVTVKAISGARVLSHERIQGPEGSPMLWSDTVATVRGERIIRLEWTLNWGLAKSGI